MSITTPTSNTPSSTLTDDVAARIRQLLTFGELGEPFPPERRLAELFRVSRVTIRRSLEQLEYDGLISKEGRRGTYGAWGPPILPPEALAIARGRGCIALLTNQVGDRINPQLSPWFTRVSRALIDINQQQTAFCWINSDRFFSAMTGGEIKPDSIRGFVTASTTWSPADYQAALDLGTPFVGLGQSRLNFHWNTLGFDSTSALTQAIDDIRPDSTDRIFIPCDPYPDSASSQLWLETVLDRLSRCGVRPDRIVAKAGGIFETDGYFATRWYLRTHGIPTVILAQSDLAAAGAYRALAAAREADLLDKHDYRQIRFLGLLDMGICQYLDPLLSSISFSYQQIAQIIIEMLAEQHQLGGPTTPRKIEGRYIGRASSRIQDRAARAR